MRDLFPDWKPNSSASCSGSTPGSISACSAAARACAKPTSASPPSWTASTSPAGGAALVEPSRKAPRSAPAAWCVMLALALPAFRETSDDDWLKKSELAVTFLDRYGNEVGKRGIRHNDSVPLEELPDHLIKAVLATEDRRFYEHFGIDVLGTVARADRPMPRAGGVVQGGSSHHPAARQEPVPHQRAHDRAQDQGGVPRAVAGGAPDQERDPQALSRPRLYGRRHLRRRRGGAVLFRQVGARREPRRSRDAGRPVQGADQIRAARQPAGRARARQRRARQHGRGRLHDRGPGVRRPAQSRRRRSTAATSARRIIISTGPSTR